VGEEREVEENGGEEREGKETNGCPLTIVPLVSFHEWEVVQCSKHAHFMSLVTCEGKSLCLIFCNLTDCVQMQVLLISMPALTRCGI
jgi:hypothetical protein